MSFVRDARIARVLLALACAVVVGLVSAVPASAAKGDKKDKQRKNRAYVVEEGPCDLDTMPKAAVRQWTPAGESIVHKVAYGQGLQGIAKKYGIKGKEPFRVLWDANPQLDQLLLERSGITIRIPACGSELQRRKLPKPPPEPEPQEPEEAEETQDADGGSAAESAPEPDPAPAVADESVWDRLAECESGGNWSINTGNGYYGGLQFSLNSWRGVGGSGYPHEHSREEQIKRGKMLKANGGWGHWPSCAAKLGLL
jgi:hypothetical protein